MRFVGARIHPVARFCASSSTFKDTKIPKGHDKIIAAVDQFFNFPGAGKWAHAIREVKKFILDQKQASMKKTSAVERGIILYNLQQEAEKLLVILKDRNTDIKMWGLLLGGCLANLHQLTSKALSK